MSSLIGKAQEDDDAFWSHGIWSEASGGFADGRSRKRRRDEEAESSSGEEEEGSGGEGVGGGGGGGDEDEDEDEDDSASDGEGSYRMSDEDSAAAADQFDSDFDESESDEGGGGEEGEGEEERELHDEERRDAATKRKKNQRLGGTAMALQSSSSAGRGLMKKKAGRVTRRGPLGVGWNEGLVLNWPPPQPPSDGTAGAASAKGPGRPRISDSKSAIVPVAQSLLSIPASATANPPHIPSHPATAHPPADTERIDKETPALSAQHDRPMGAASAPASPSTKTANHKHPATKLKSQLKQEAISERKKSQRTQFTQEELILESIKFTETENAKWLNARKRNKEEAAQLEKNTGRNSKRSSLNQHPISRFHSRRGCNTTFTFMDMDHLPEILTRGHTSSSGVHSASYAGTTTPTRRRRLGSSSSEASESSHPTLEKKYEKCVITGKVAKYRDPKTMLGYHDLNAYKELRRRSDAGKLKISRPYAQKSNGSNNGVISKRKGANSTKFAFAHGQPTMVAEVATSGTNKVEVRVRVMQNGVPVSPPSGSGIHFNLPSEMPPTAEGSQENRKEPPPLLPPLPSLGQLGDFGLTNQNIFGDIDLGINTEHLNNGHHAVIDRWNAKSGSLIAAAANERTPDLSNSSEFAHQVEHLSGFEAPSDDFEFIPFFTEDGSAHSMGGIEYSSGVNVDAAIFDSKNVDGKVGDTKPRLALLRSTPETTTSALLASNDQLKNAKHVESNEGIAPTPPAMKINARKNANGDDKGIPVEVTKSNDKRTTIEAN